MWMSSHPEEGVGGGVVVVVLVVVVGFFVVVEVVSVVVVVLMVVVVVILGVVVVIAGCVVPGSGPGGQGQVERSGSVGPLVHPVQLDMLSPHSVSR